MPFKTLVATLAAGLLFTMPARAGDPIAGLPLAQDHCARCHTISGTSTSPLSVAPTFAEIVERYPPRDLEEGLAEGVVTGHPEMPEFIFTPDEIENFIAYLKALQ